MKLLLLALFFQAPLAIAAEGSCTVYEAKDKFIDACMLYKVGITKEIKGKSTVEADVKKIADDCVCVAREFPVEKMAEACRYTYYDVKLILASPISRIMCLETKGEKK